MIFFIRSFFLIQFSKKKTIFCRQLGQLLLDPEFIGRKKDKLQNCYANALDRWRREIRPRQEFEISCIVRHFTHAKAKRPLLRLSAFSKSPGINNFLRCRWWKRLARFDVFIFQLFRPRANNLPSLTGANIIGPISKFLSHYGFNNSRKPLAQKPDI